MTIGKRVKEALKGDFAPMKSRHPLTSGEAVRLAREYQGLTQPQLSTLCGIPQSTISAIENNSTALGVGRAKKLARALKIHPAVLVFPSWEVEESTPVRSGGRSQSAA